MGNRKVNPYASPVCETKESIGWTPYVGMAVTIVVAVLYVGTVWSVFILLPIWLVSLTL